MPTASDALTTEELVVQLLTTTEAARVVGITPGSVRRAIFTGELPVSRTLGRMHLIAKADLHAWWTRPRKPRGRVHPSGRRGKRQPGKEQA